ncbi:MAG TPA: redox-regulated ATPase YchF [Candidatus Nanoarchaeia archaeon]|nr:redox-regulated ATPase YchF [Candidatus Nanoarchaeia archaeon]
MLIGIVGKPSVGKSSFFKACTLAEVDIANYPFTTIKPNRAVGYVKIDCIDKELGKQCNPRSGFCINGKRFVPVELLDVAGIIEGAHEDKGLGFKFLNDLSQADILIHVVDASGSTNEKGDEVIALSHDPCKDIKFLERELDLWLLGIIKKGWDKFVRQHVTASIPVQRAIAEQLSGLKVTEDIAEELLKNFNPDLKTWDENTLLQLAVEVRKKTKPMIIAANKVDVPGTEKNIERLREQFPDYLIVPCSAASEIALREASKTGVINYVPGESNFEIKTELNEKQKKGLEFVKNNVLDRFKSTGVQNVLDEAVFNLLNYIAIYPGGVNKLTDSQGRTLPDCFLLKKGSTALDFAYKLHTDFGKNFIRAINVKTRLTVGKDYLLNHRDVIEIVANR